LVSAGWDGNVKLWNLTTGQESLTLRGHLVGGRSVTFSHDGNQIVSACHDRTVRGWDGTPLENEARQEGRTLRAPDSGVRSVAFSPDGRHIASAGDDGTVRLWDFTRGLAGVAHPLLRTLPGGKGPYLNLAFSKDGQSLALVAGGKLTVWNTTTWKESL